MNKFDQKANKATNTCKKREICYFNQFVCQETVNIPPAKPDVEEVLRCIVDPQIVSVRVIDTPEGISEEGQELTGKKVSFEIKLKQKILYISTHANQSVHAVENDFLCSTYIVVPKCIKGSKIEDLIQMKYLAPHITIESADAQKLTPRLIFKNIVVLIELKICPTYSLCYTESHNCNHGKIFVGYENMAKKMELANIDNGKLFQPKWSNCGQKMAVICRNRHESYLGLCSLRGKSIQRITGKNAFCNIYSYTWGRDSSHLYLSAKINQNIELFEIEFANYELTRITYSREGCSNIKPKISPCGKAIGFIKVINDKGAICRMDLDGLNVRKISDFGWIKDFDWQNCGQRIGYIQKHEIPQYSEKDYSLGLVENGDEIYIVDTVFGDKTCLKISELKLCISKIKFSPDNRYIAFTGDRAGTQDLYIYDLLKQKCKNLTRHEFENKISDFDWNVDGTKLYYSGNVLGYYNLFEIDIHDGSIKQLSNSDANFMEISCRPKIL